MTEKKFTKYERARIIGNRSLQIAEGAPLLLKLSDEDLKKLRFDPIEIAKKEFEAGVIPLDVLRSDP
jgi:DNA-directed RNA polymerase subunit K